MRVLAIDTSFDACSAAILGGAAVLWSEQHIIGRGHAEILPPMVAQGFAETKLRAKDIDRIGVVIGPGAFAGIRVGLAFARGLCLGTKARAVGVTSLQALAASVSASQDLIAPVFDARRGQVYAALYDRMLRERIAPFVAAPDDAAGRIRNAAANEPVALAGSGGLIVGELLKEAAILEGADFIDPVAVAKLAAAAELTTAAPAPLYLRPPDAKPSSGSLFAGLVSP